MGKSMKDADAGRKSRRSILWLVMAALLAVLISVFAFLRFYSAYIDKTLYAERLSQMREVTTQLFAGLEDVMNNQWRTASEQCRTLQREKPQTMDGLMDFLQDQAVLGELADIQCDIIAVDNLGVYYTQEGRQGLIGEREYLLSSSERVSYVSNSLISDETRMVFLQRLEEPVTVENGGQQTTLIYYGISQNMEELNPYFECSAYNGNNSVYVVDEAGLRLFSSNGDGLLKGFNIYHILEGMEYLHGSSFDLARKELEVENIAYSNAVINDTEVYYALYRMENAEWTLIFLVPSAYVATNTVALVNTTIRMVLIFAVLLVIFSAAAIFWLMRMQQQAQRVEAFEQVKPGDYDAVLLDIQMPRMNGLEASRTIRGGSNPLGQTIPIIAMTANAFTEDIRDCLNAGMDAHVSKPIDIAVLERTLRNLMAENAGGGQNPETGDGIDLIERP